MALQLNRKYATLPDLDSAPDVYETPELTDDNSTAAGRARSDSNASSYKDFEDIETDTPGISRSRLHPEEARLHFSPAVIDARDVDFSDRVTAKRKSYKTSTRRQRQREDGVEQYGDFSDEDDVESLERKLARLKREIEEIKEDFSRRQAMKNDVLEKDFPDLEPEISELTKVLDGISTSKSAAKRRYSGKFEKDLGTGSKASGPPQTSQTSSEPATYTVTYAPMYQQSHALAKAADFDTRLALLEKALGISHADMPSLTSNGTHRAILPILDTLQRQISVILQSTPSSLDGISRRVRSLMQETDKLEGSRKAAKLAQDALKNEGGDVVFEDAEDSEQVAKINALYGTLPTIENLGPLIPPLLDRLRSLRAIHTDAATASSALDGVEKRQAEMAEEIKKWREGLEKVEAAMKLGETTMNSNMRVVEGWVEELEQKIKKL